MTMIQIEEGYKYNILNAEFFPMGNILYLHYVRKKEGQPPERVYVPLYEPTYEFYISEKAERVFQEKEENLTKHSCVFNNRYFYLANQLGYDKNELRNPETKSMARSQIMADQRLFGADAKIEPIYLAKARKELEEAGVFDETILGRVGYFDIETSFDYNTDDLNNFIKITKSSQEEYKRNYVFNKFPGKKFLLEKEATIESILKMINDFELRPQELKLIPEWATMCDEEQYKLIQSYLKSILPIYRANVGEIDPVSAPNMIETVTYFNKDIKLLVHYLLIKPEWLDPEFGADFVSKNHEYYRKIYEDYFNIESIKTEINQMRKTVIKEEGEEFFNELMEFVQKYGETSDYKEMEEMKEIFFKKFKPITDKYYQHEWFEFKFKIFFKELNLIVNFMYDLRNEYKPSFLVAHNNKFDIQYIQHRLEYYGKNPAEYFVQYINFPIDDVKPNLTYLFNIDERAESTKKDKTVFTSLGLIHIDSLLFLAKAEFKERDSYSLDNILKKDFNETKFQYRARTIETLYLHFDHFIKYANLDTLKLPLIMEKKFLLEKKAYQLVGICDWKHYALPSIISYYTLRKEYKEKYGLIIQNVPNGYLSKIGRLYKETLVGAYVTDLVQTETYGLHSYVSDTDAASLYPSIMRTSNTFADRLKVCFENEEIFRSMMFNPLEYLITMGIITEGELYEKIFDQ